MRYFRMFALHMQDIFEQRGRTFVWLLISCIAPLIMILFWRGAKGVNGWSFEEILSYYLLLIVFRAMLISHNEERVAVTDIQEGQLTAYLVKPFSYFWLVFFQELPYRLFQGGIGILFLVLCFQLLRITSSVELFMLSVVSIILSFFLGFIFKMIIGLCAFWMTDSRGLFEVVDVTLVIFTGLLMPLAFYPQWLESVSYFLPFAYMLYFPIVMVQGQLDYVEVFKALSMQLFWIGLLVLVYRLMWRSGIRKYTAVGQ